MVNILNIQFTNKSSFYQSRTWFKDCVYSPSGFNFKVNITGFIRKKIFEGKFTRQTYDVIE